MKAVRIPEKIEKVSAEWVTTAPFFSEFLLRFYYYECDERELMMPTMGVGVEGGKIKLYYTKKFLDSLKKEELYFVLVHEILHLLSLHSERKLNRDDTIWNIACDSIINYNIKNICISRSYLKPLPGTPTLDDARKLGYKGEEISECLYEWLVNKYEEYKKQHDGDINIEAIFGSSGKEKSGKKSSAAGKGKKGKGDRDDNTIKKLFKAFDTHEKLAKKLTEIDKQAIQEAINSAKIRGWGSISGTGLDVIRELVRAGQLNWKQLLRKYTERWTWGKSNYKYKTWSRRNRRQLPIPGFKRLHNDIVIAIDTSGSISYDDIKDFMSEIEKIARDKDRLTLIECDCEIKHVYNNYRRGDYRKIKIHGRGGTDFQPVFDWMTENKKEKALLIYFTDLWASHDINTYGIKSIWVTKTNEKMPQHLGPTICIK